MSRSTPTRVALVAASLSWLVLGFALAQDAPKPESTPDATTQTPAPEKKAERTNQFSIATANGFTLDINNLLESELAWGDRETKFSGPLYSWINARNDAFPGANVATTLEPRTLDMRIRRARTMLSGQAVLPWLHYKVDVQWRGEKTRPELLDAYLVLGHPQGWSGTFGQFKPPFDLFRLTDPWELHFTELPVASERLAPDYDIGAMGAWRSKSGRVLLRLAVQNGTGRNASGNENDKLLTTFRAEYQNAGGFDYNLPASLHPSAFEYTVGVALTSNPEGGLQDTDSGDACSIGVSSNCGYETKKRYGIEGFFAVRQQDISLATNYQQWTYEDALVTDQFGSTGNLKRVAFQIEGGYFVWKKFEVVLRYATLDDQDSTLTRLPVGPAALTAESGLVAGDRPNLVESRLRSKEFGLGVNYYWLARRARLHVGWSQTRDENVLFDRFRSYIPDIGRGNPVVRPFEEVSLDGRIQSQRPTWRAVLSFYL